MNTNERLKKLAARARKPSGACPECRGTGVYKQKIKNAPDLKCTECNGTGKAQHFLMIFWAYDQFPYVLADRGFMRDDGLAYVPSYNACFRPTRTMALTEGERLKREINKLADERSTLFTLLDENFRQRLQHIAHYVLKK